MRSNVKLSESNAFQAKQKQRYLIQLDQIMVSRGTFENRALPSLHGGLLEITHTVPFKINLLLKTIIKCVITRMKQTAGTRKM